MQGFLQGPRRRPPPRRQRRRRHGHPRDPGRQDFSKFGPIETKPLSRIKQLSGPHLHRAWLNVPHVTHTTRRTSPSSRPTARSSTRRRKKKGYRVTLLAFLIKASVSALKQFPEFNSSLAPEKDALIYKKYYHIGIAVDTPEGLVVPVFKDVDRKGILELSQELGDISDKARDGKLAPADMQGGTFTISCLGGIGGTDFTPIVNAPEVAILGVVALEDGAGLGRRGVQAAADAAAVALLRPPRDRRRPGRPLHAPPVPRAGRRAPAGPLSGGDDR